MAPVVATPPDEELRPRTSLRASSLDLRCPGCGTLLDAPRIRPDSGTRERKCPSCHSWYPVQRVRRSPSAPAGA